jgi:hypothetical protein
MQLAEYTDWRLPNLNELQSIVDYTRRDPAIDGTIFSVAMSSGYWSSTTIASYTDFVRNVSSSDGYIYHGYKSYDKFGGYFVRCVRAGQ